MHYSNCFCLECYRFSLRNNKLIDEKENENKGKIRYKFNTNLKAKRNLRFGFLIVFLFPLGNQFNNKMARIMNI